MSNKREKPFDVKATNHPQSLHVPLQAPHLLARSVVSPSLQRPAPQVRLLDSVADRLFSRLELPGQRPRRPSSP